MLGPESLFLRRRVPVPRPAQDLVLLDGAVGLADAHDQREAERERRHADHDRGEDQHVRQRIRIDREGVAEDRRGAADQLARRDVEQVDRGLEDAQTRPAS